MRELQPDILGMSALLTTTVPQQKVVIEALKKEGLFDSIKVMVGGAPVTQEWATEIGADGFAPGRARGGEPREDPAGDRGGGVAAASRSRRHRPTRCGGRATHGDSIRAAMTGRVSIRDVAREAGVSVTTVSHALNGKGRLNAETRKRVREVADRLGYRPNPAARSLVSGHTGLIAAIPSLPRELRVEFTEFGFFSELITAATGVAVGRDQRPGRVARRRRLVHLGSRAAGRRDRDRAGGGRAGAPGPAPPRDPVRHDLDRPRRRRATMRSFAPTIASGAQRVLDHLATAGADRVAMLAPPPLNAFTRDCAETYRRWCTLRDRPPRLEVVGMTDLARGRDGAYLAALDRLLDRRPAPDALFVPIELAGVMVLEELASRGIAVPDDVLLATTHDIGRGVATVPQMTTLEWNYAELGRRAATMLLDLIDGTRSAPCEEVVPTTLMPRASTAR